MGYSAVGYFEYIFFFWIYYYFAKIRQVGDQQSALFTTISVLDVDAHDAAGRAGFPIVWSLVTEKKLAGLSGALSRASVSARLCFASASTSRAPGAWLLLLSSGAGICVGLDGPFWATAIDLGGKEVGAAGGIMNTGANLGGFIAPTLTPLIASVAGWSWALYFASLVVLVGCCLLVLHRSLARALGTNGVV